MPTHMNLHYSEIESLWPGVVAYQKLAQHHGVSDIFSDNGGKVAQLAIAVGLDIAKGRQGPDALDRMGNLYELKTMDLTKKTSGFSTNHHLHKGTIDKYRERRFIFATYDGITLQEAYMVLPKDMEVVYKKWLDQLRKKDHLNNPKVPLDYVRDVGTIMYMKDVAPSWMKDKTPLAEIDS